MARWEPTLEMGDGIVLWEVDLVHNGSKSDGLIAPPGNTVKPPNAPCGDLFSKRTEKSGVEPADKRHTIRLAAVLIDAFVGIKAELV
ncbi:hypothetical protein O5D80_006453 [Batrachochytrium dendrobatidis]|nr:hypothetical protein O5D80_006453 [Batrachochytrium dendrobatidis]